MSMYRMHLKCCSLVTLTLVWCSVLHGQSLEVRSGDPVPREVRDMYGRGLSFLSRTQASDGSWQSQQQGGRSRHGGHVFYGFGEDPNFGMYSGNIRRAIKYIISSQDKTTGYFGGSMYHHGFACLGLAEAYGAVDDRNLWDGVPNAPNRSIGQSLELAVRSAITAQKSNTFGAWRYNPSGSDADTSVAGAVLMGMLAARNAGIEVPDEAIDRAISYFIKMTAPSGQVAYSGGVGGFNESMARIAIANLVFSVARRKDIPQYKTTLGYLKDKIQGEARDTAESNTRAIIRLKLFSSRHHSLDHLEQEPCSQA